MANNFFNIPGELERATQYSTETVGKSIKDTEGFSGDETNMEHAVSIERDAFDITTVFLNNIKNLSKGPGDGTGDDSEALARDTVNISGEAESIAPFADALSGETNRIAEPMAKVTRKTTHISMVPPDAATVTAAGALRAPSIREMRNFMSIFMTLISLPFNPTLLRLLVKYALILQSISQYLEGNPITGKTVEYIWQKRSEVAQFLIDLIEPLKLSVPSSSSTGNGQNLNKYNELDMEISMNRHAMGCQFKRLFKSIVILEKDAQSEIPNIIMDTRLESDDGGVIESQEEGKELRDKETWLFINGIAGEPHWVHLACNRLGDKFKRKVHGVLNRTDGILWDLLECAGERTMGDSTVTDRTLSSNRAQKELKNTLEKYLTTYYEEEHKIILIAHSQGCLLLRLVLKELGETNEYSLRMKERLRVFTFGNPSPDWGVSQYCYHTEHFANCKDFVARLGVLHKCYKKGQDEQIFINKTWTGHLFGTQYSLEASDYGTGESWLLRCAAGQLMK